MDPELNKRIDALRKRVEDLLHRLTLLEGNAAGPGTPSASQHTPVRCQESATVSTEQPSATQARLSEELRSKGIDQFAFKRVPHDYYQRDLEYRRACLGAHSTEHLCKSIVMENTKISEEEAVGTPKYICVIVQYVARLHADKLKQAAHRQQKEAGGELSVKRFNMRLVHEEVSDRLTGFQHNAVTPVGSASPQMPIVMSHRIAQLQPPEAFMWLGGGEPDLKLGFRVQDFLSAYRPSILDCTYD